MENKPKRPKGDWPCAMVDIEATGMRPDRHAVLQIAALRFDPTLRDIDVDDMFNVSIQIPYARGWQESTRSWWLDEQGRTDHLAELLNTGEPVMEALQKFMDWLGPVCPQIWAKNSHYDVPFIDSYLQDHGFKIPWRYWEVENLPSFIRARYFPNKVGIGQKMIPNGGAHDAIFDCIHQVSWLFAVLDDTEARVGLKPVVIEDNKPVEVKDDGN